MEKEGGCIEDTCDIGRRKLYTQCVSSKIV